MSDILLKRSLITGSIPTTTSLLEGELAINVPDGKIFLRKSGSTSDTIQSAITTGTNNIGNVQLSGSLSVSGSGDVLTAQGDNIYFTGNTMEFSGDVFEMTGSLIVVGNTILSGSLNVTQGITGSLFGTASFAQTASFITGSNVFGPFGANSIASASFAISSSNAQTASFASTTSFLNTLNQDLTFNGNLTLNGTASISTLVVNQTQYSSGSNQLGDGIEDTQTLFGNVRIPTGSLNITGSTNTTFLTASGLNYPPSDNGEESFIQTDGNGNLSLQYVKTIYEEIINGEATQLVKGTPVYVSGSQGAASIVYRADAGDPSKMPVIYISADTLSSGQAGRGIALGLIKGIDTTGYPAGTEIYLASGGGWTSTRPTGSAIVQTLGYVTKEGNGGQGVILNPGPNSLPNLPSGSVWVGNNNSLPVSVLTSSLSVASASFATTASFVPGYISGSGTAGQVAFFNGTNSQTGDNGLFWDNVNKRLGVGTTTPSQSLHINGNIWVQSSADSVNAIIVSNSSFIAFANTSNTIGSRVRGTGNSFIFQDNLANTRAAITTQGGGGVTYFANGGGSVVIGATTAGARLDVRAQGALSSDIAFRVRNSADSANILSIAGEGSSTLIGRLNITPTTSTTSSLVVTGPTILSGSQNTMSGSVLTVVGSGSAQPVFTVQGSQGELFSVVDSLSGSLFSVNDISGLPIVEVFSDGTTLMGNYLDPMLVTTALNTLTNSGSFTIYSLPTASYNTAFYEYSIRSGSNARAGQIMAIQLGSVVNFTETTTMDFGSTSGVSLGVFVSGSNMVLTGSAATTAWTIKTIIRGI